ncbi:hypothetical protein Poli38472_007105 [Pythium oligandrum]|uniref:Ankyrin repeat-containing domain n=1 Tax=Pythium oligandrum TaxID=41045 RepID=A0A8K1C9H4_PYTOL|nr:hypothetical protein Poli38472_007105 [Pythium oligandrum]|eukprot:TMW58960.1 hypothetical protein Poli38472_007105 [Pythium oligandrum]
MEPMETRTSDASSVLDQDATSALVPQDLWMVVQDDRCRYPSVRCENKRALKSNDSRHRFCDFHRRRASSNQRRLHARRRPRDAAELAIVSTGAEASVRVTREPSLSLIEEELDALLALIAESNQETTSDHRVPDGVTELREAIVRWDFEEVRRLHEGLSENAQWKCDGAAMHEAVKANDEAFMQWHFDHCVNNDSAWLIPAAVDWGRIHVLMQALARDGSVGVMENAILHAVRSGPLEVLQFFHENVKYGWPTTAAEEAAVSGRVNVLEWLHAHRSDGWTTSAMDLAAMHGQLEAVQWLHANRKEGCTTAAIDGAASIGHLPIVEWLHVHRSEGCTTKAMDMAAENGHLSVVQWLHSNRMEGCTSNAMTGAACNGYLEVVEWLHENRTEGCSIDTIHGAAQNGHWNTVEWLVLNRQERCSVAILHDAIAHKQLRVVQALYDRAELRSWPRLAHASVLVKLVDSDDPVAREILRYIVSCRQQRYHLDAKDNPAFAAKAAVVASDSVVKLESRGFVLTAASKLSRFPEETNKLISDFILHNPSRQITRSDAVKYGWSHWLVQFSSHPIEDMDQLVEQGRFDEALWMHERLKGDGRAYCSEHFMYLVMAKNDLAVVQWHTRNCDMHSFSRCLYMATWIGRLDIVEWFRDCREELRHLVRSDSEGEGRSKQTTLSLAISTSFEDSRMQFESRLMEVELVMDDVELAARMGDLTKLKNLMLTRSKTQGVDVLYLLAFTSPNAPDLAAIYGHLPVVHHLLRRELMQCSVGGLCGAILRGHLDIVRYLYENQPELASWLTIEDGPHVLRLFLDPVKQDMLEFFRQEHNMRLEAKDVTDAVYREDVALVRLIRELDLVDWTTVPAHVTDLAAVRGNYKMLRTLCRGRRSFSTRAIDGAAEEGHLRIIQYLHQRKAQCTRRAMDLAAKNGHEDVVRFLLEHRQEGCSSYALLWATDKITRLLYITELILLNEFTEVIIPVMYGIYLLVISHLPNRAYYPQLASLNDKELMRSISAVVVNAALELVSLVVIMVIHSALTVWLLYVIQYSLAHSGVDFTLRFAWLRSG